MIWPRSKTWANRDDEKTFHLDPHLADALRAVEEAVADWIHVEVMDGHFVRNLPMCPAIVWAIRTATALPLDVHLMIERFSYHRFWGNGDSQFKSQTSVSVTPFQNIVAHHCSNWTISGTY